MSNRVMDYAEMVQSKLDNLGNTGLDGRPIVDFESEMSLTMADFIGYQNAQSRAFASGKLSLDESRTVYITLGGEVFKGDWPTGTTLALKIAITRLVGELLGVTE